MQGILQDASENNIEQFFYKLTHGLVILYPEHKDFSALTNARQLSWVHSLTKEQHRLYLGAYIAQNFASFALRVRMRAGAQLQRFAAPC